MKYGDDIRYGMEFYPFAITMAVGLFISSTGPGIFRSLTAGITGIPAYQWLLLAGMLLLQVLGAVIAVAGFFGALRRVLDDSC